LLALHVCSLVFVAQGVARQEWLLGEGLLRFSLVTTTAGAALNIALNAWLIPRHGALGAAAATVVSLAVSDVLASLLWSRTRAAGFWQLRALLGAWKLPPARA
jgi:PST family polysaccharide transporter